MDIDATLIEILYIISNYEKGRFDTVKRWNSKYIKSIRESMQIMKYIMEMLYNKQYITTKDFLPIIQFYEKNIDVIFPDSKYDIKKLLVDETVFFSLDFDCGQQVSNEIIELMLNIIEECIYYLENKPQKGKIKISYLLKAFHNLPRAFMKPVSQTLFNLNTLPLAPDEALMYAKLYINQIQNCSI